MPPTYQGDSFGLQFVDIERQENTPTFPTVEAHDRSKNQACHERKEPFKKESEADEMHEASNEKDEKDRKASRRLAHAPFQPNM